jgi:hypothetical protein
MTSQFKSHGYSFATLNVRVPMTAPFITQQEKAGFENYIKDIEKHNDSNARAVIQAYENNVARERKKQRKRRFIM